MTKRNRYRSLSREDIDFNTDLMSLEQEGRTNLPCWVYPLVIFCTFSVILSLSLLNRLEQCDDDLKDLRVSRYAKANYVELPWVWDSPFTSHGNDTLVSQTWDAISIDAGVIALHDDDVDSMGLPRSQRFPWDEKKGVYILNAYHSLHCLKRLHSMVMKAKNGLEQSTPWEHALHCIDTLRQDVICHADDTPRYTGLDQPTKSSGLGQKRQCRDWGAVEAWGQANTACWKYINETDEHINTFERYKFCPEGSPYVERIETMFGPPSRWKTY